MNVIEWIGQCAICDDGQVLVKDLINTYRFTDYSADKFLKRLRSKEKIGGRYECQIWIDGVCEREYYAVYISNEGTI